MTPQSDGIHHHECGTIFIIFYKEEASSALKQTECGARKQLVPFLYLLWFDMAEDQNLNLPYMNWTLQTQLLRRLLAIRKHFSYSAKKEYALYKSCHQLYDYANQRQGSIPTPKTESCCMGTHFQIQDINMSVYTWNIAMINFKSMGKNFNKHNIVHVSVKNMKYIKHSS